MEQPLDALSLLPTSYFSDAQKRILTLKAEGKTYVQISEEMSRITQRNIFPRHISLCLRKSALGFKWELNDNPTGVPPFLCPADIDSLTMIIKEACDNGSPMDPYEVLDEACSLKSERIAKGIKFLEVVGCNDLKISIAQESVDTPVRSWINKIINECDAHLRNRRYIDAKRLESCAVDVIQGFIISYQNLFNETVPFLIFGADETMLESSCKLKAVLPNGTNVSFEANFPDMPHISAMLCHNVFGVTLPPFIILSDLKHCPEELKPFTLTNQLWLASTPNGYMNRDGFLLWSLHFITWLSCFRTTLPESLREQSALLILDGHTSRENPIALFLLRRFNVQVLVLPSHTTHVLQMFDRVLAAVLKAEFGPKFRKLLKKSIETNMEFASDLARTRYCAVVALLDSWKKSATSSNCLKAAKIVGIYPPDPSIAAQSSFVRDLTPVERERYNARQQRLMNRLNISGQIITTPEKITEIVNALKNKPRFAHLCNLEQVMQTTFSRLVRDLLQFPKNDTFLLSTIPPFFSPNRAPVFFDLN